MHEQFFLYGKAMTVKNNQRRLLHCDVLSWQIENLPAREYRIIC